MRPICECCVQSPAEYLCGVTDANPLPTLRCADCAASTCADAYRVDDIGPSGAERHAERILSAHQEGPALHAPSLRAAAALLTVPSVAGHGRAARMESLRRLLADAAAIRESVPESERPLPIQRAIDAERLSAEDVRFCYFHHGARAWSVCLEGAHHGRRRFIMVGPRGSIRSRSC